MNYFQPQLLSAAYDSGRLVPFIGAGMSMPACVSWENFVRNLEAQYGRQNADPAPGDLIQRAFFAMQRLRLSGNNVACAIKNAVYVSDEDHVPQQTRLLAKLYWPLVCTTNYDDLYLRAKCEFLKKHPETVRLAGRSDADCRDVLRHMSFPIGEMVWVLQGFLRPRSLELQKSLDESNDIGQLEKELVVGHVEYRRVAHREPHFRRCFAEVFRRSSFLFVGSGLADRYFLTLLMKSSS